MSTLQLVASRPQKDNSPSSLWDDALASGAGTPVAPPAQGNVMESGVEMLATLEHAPLRTLHNAPLVKSSPLPQHVRSMIEARAFGRRFDAHPMDTDSIASSLPTIACPADGDVRFAANDISLEALNISVDGLLQHRKRLLASTINRELPRQHVLVIGAGPAGLLAAIQMALRDHRVVVCEQREVYARNRYIGVYKEVTHLMAALGMPESMTYDFSQYRGKRGIMLSDIQTFLHGVALKLGVVIYTGAVARSLQLSTIQGGEVKLERATDSGNREAGAIGVVRWEHDTVARVASGVRIRFGAIVEASGGRSGLREALVGPESVVSMYDLGRQAADEDPSLASYFDDPDDHCAEYVDSDYGCPPGLLETFSRALRSGDRSLVPTELPCFVSNIDASVFSEKMRQSDGSLGMASRVGDRDLDIPHDWVVLECRLSDGSLSRYHVEGPLPQTFEFRGERKPTAEVLGKLNPVSFLLRILYAMGLPFNAIDRRKLVEFYTAESSHGDASDIVSAWVGRFNSLRVGADKPIWSGRVPGALGLRYGILGEAFQNAWYRFGVGVDDAFIGASVFAESLELDGDEHTALLRRMEKIMRSRSVQVLYHLYAVAQDRDKGVVGSVLTEYHMEGKHSEDLAEARLRALVERGQQMRAVQSDLLAGGRVDLLDAGIVDLRGVLGREALAALDSFAYLRGRLAEVRRIEHQRADDWRSRVDGGLRKVLSPEHQAMILPLFDDAPSASDEIRSPRRQQRLVELASGHYPWVTPWVRACALRAVDATEAAGLAALQSAAEHDDHLIAETARRRLIDVPATERSIVDKVITLRDVSIFADVPDEALAGVARLLTDRQSLPGEALIEEGEFGDSLYVIESGKVRVHQGERTIREMGAHEFFGELSLLDAEPRSASVTSIEPTHAYRLSQDDFYALVGERPEIARSINRALCRMIRTGG